MTPIVPGRELGPVHHLPMTRYRHCGRSQYRPRCPSTRDELQNTATGSVSSQELTTMVEEREVIDHLQRRGEDGAQDGLTRQGVFHEVNIWLASCCITHRKPSPWRFVHLRWSSTRVASRTGTGKLLHESWNEPLSPAHVSPQTRLPGILVPYLVRKYVTVQ